MNDPSIDLVLLKKLCNELQRELAYSQADTDAVARLARDSFRLYALRSGVEWYAASYSAFFLRDAGFLS